MWAWINAYAIEQVFSTTGTDQVQSFQHLPGKEQIDY